MAEAKEKLEVKEETKNPIDFVLKTDVKISLNLMEFNMLKRALAPFVFADSVLENVKNELFKDPNNILPYYEEDLEVGQDGNKVLKQSFWDKHKPKSPTVEAKDLK